MPLLLLALTMSVLLLPLSLVRSLLPLPLSLLPAVLSLLLLLLLPPCSSFLTGPHCTFSKAAAGLSCGGPAQRHTGQPQQRAI
jgi:hypothetical protein